MAEAVHPVPDGFNARIGPRELTELSVGTFFYAGIYLTEGVGLILRKRWAEYLTIISTAAFIPLEIYEIAKHVGVVRALVLLVNIVIVTYLVLDLRHALGGAEG